MNRLSIAALFAGAFALSTLDVCAETWPKLSLGGGLPQCAEALMLARSVFESDAARLYAPPTVPPDLRSALVMQPVALDISGGNALVVDPAYIDKLPIGKQGERGYLYWQKQALHGKRLVVKETPFSWQGARYSLSMIGETVSRDALMAEVMSSQIPANATTIISDGWRPPLLLRNNDTGHFWVVDVGPPYEVLGEWKVYTSGPEGITQRCVVQFRPGVSHAITLLPPEVRQLAQLLDQTLGDGEKEGTLQPAAMLRLDVEHAWANVALRPWGLGEPYNTRQEVDAGLNEWSGRSAANRRIHRNIQRQYPVAERALAEYYQRNFQQTSTDALRLAAHALDNAFRACYAFQRQ